MLSDGEVMEEDLVLAADTVKHCMAMAQEDMEVEVMAAMEIMAPGNVQSTEKLWRKKLSKKFDACILSHFFFILFFFVCC